MIASRETVRFFTLR